MTDTMEEGGDTRAVSLRHTEAKRMADSLHRQVSHRVECINPEMAKSYLELNSQNRPPKAGKVASYRAAITANKFVYSGENIIFDEDGQLLDGQHRLMACVDSGLPIVASVLRGVPRDARRYLDRGTSRTMPDILAIEGYTNTNVTAAIANTLVAIRAGQPLNHPAAARRYRGVSGLADDMVTYIESNQADIQRSIKHLITAIQRRKLIGTGVACATWIEFSYAESADKADEFWMAVLTGENLRREDPRMQFRNRLLDAVTSSVSDERHPEMRKRDTHRKALRGNMAKLHYAIKAWNYWITETNVYPIQAVSKAKALSFPTILSSNATKQQIKSELGVRSVV